MNEIQPKYVFKIILKSAKALPLEKLRTFVISNAKEEFRKKKPSFYLNVSKINSKKILENNKIKENNINELQDVLLLQARLRRGLRMARMISRAASGQSVSNLKRILVCSFGLRGPRRYLRIQSLLNELRQTNNNNNNNSYKGIACGLHNMDPITINLNDPLPIRILGNEKICKWIKGNVDYYGKDTKIKSLGGPNSIYGKITSIIYGSTTPADIWRPTKNLKLSLSRIHAPAIEYLPYIRIINTYKKWFYDSIRRVIPPIESMNEYEELKNIVHYTSINNKTNLFNKHLSNDIILRRNKFLTKLPPGYVSFTTLEMDELKYSYGVIRTLHRLSVQLLSSCLVERKGVIMNLGGKKVNSSYHMPIVQKKRLVVSEREKDLL